MTSRRTAAPIFPGCRRPALLAGLSGALLVSGVALAAPPTLEVPIDCEVGRTCFIQNYVDRDPGADYRDYTCGRLSYDGHKGTDFRLRTHREMLAGVRVLAAAPGVVRAVRDGMRDISVKAIGAAAVAGREAGNSVVVRHGDGWEIQYSHMREGSVAVRQGDRVEAGQVLGQVGLSGRTEFPHLHLEVRHRGKTVDPFVGLTDTPGCDPPTAKTLWSRAALASQGYLASGLLGAGFTPGKPDVAAVRLGAREAKSLPADAPALVFWVDIFGALKDDRLRIRLLAPKGSVLAESDRVFERSKAQFFQFVGKRRKGAAWRSGAYRGVFVLTREKDGRRRTVLRAERTVRIE